MVKEVSRVKYGQFRHILQPQNRKIMTTKKIIKKDLEERDITLDGFITIGKLKDGRTIGEFLNCEDARIKPFSGNFRVQGSSRGNIYMVEKPKRVRNTPIFRDDNCSLSRGKNGRYYFVFSLEEERIEELPEELVRQAVAIAEKFIMHNA